MPPNKVITMAGLIDELKWRGMLQDMTPDTEKQLEKEMTVGYVGFDPTADSLHVGSLIPIMLLVHLQRAGHQPIALVGGATGMVGDPSFKSDERKLLNEEELQHNINGIKKQLEHFLDFDASENPAVVMNNYDWMKDFTFLDFIRDVGKHITVNYMMSKDSVKKRMETGISFTEFSYQLLQGYDFYYLNKNHNCKLQMGGSDQWGNITTGTELIRRMGGTESSALTCPLMTKADGGKFGKTESGTIWLDPEKTSPYEFYQFWINASDDDAKKYIRTFSLLDRATIESIEKEHEEAPHMRKLQAALAEDITMRVHGKAAYDNAILASKILFGKSTSDELKSLSERDFLSVFKGVPQAHISKDKILEGLPIIDLLAGESEFYPSNGAARRDLKANAVSVNKEKVNDSYTTSADSLITDKYILLQKGKKNYFLVVAE